MKSVSALSLLLLALTTVACSPHAGHRRGSSTASGSLQTPKESQEALRKQEQAGFELAERAEDEQLEKLEKDALKALRAALGKEAAYPGAPLPYSSSESVAALRGAGIKLRVEPVTDGNGKAVAGGDFMQLKNSYTDRVQALSRKIAEQTASPAELKEVQNGAKYAIKLTDLGSQLAAVSTATTMSNSYLQTSSLTQMLKVSGLVRSRKLMSMDMTEEDYERVRHALERSKRAAAIASATMGMLAAYQAVINGKKANPKALDVIAESTLKAFPIKPAVTLKEAKDYVSNLSVNVAQQKGRYEAWMRKAHGDAKYERDFKANIDALFRQAEGAQEQKSAQEMANDATRRFREDREKCARGEPIDPSSPAAGPGCSAARKAALANSDSSDPATLSGPQLPAQAKAALSGLEAASKGDVAGTVDAAANLLPGDGPIKSSLQGIAALSRGDAKGAFQSALNLVSLVPGGSAIKEGLGLASKLLGFG